MMSVVEQTVATCQQTCTDMPGSFACGCYCSFMNTNVQNCTCMYVRMYIRLCIGSFTASIHSPSVSRPLFNEEAHEQ